MRLSGLPLLLSLLLAGCSSAPPKPDRPTPGDYTYTRAHLEYRIRKEMEARQLPGFSVALVDDQEVVWSQAFGVSETESGSPMTLATPFKLGSISKVFTAIEIMRLVEEGRVDLDAPLETYLPEFRIQSRFPDAPPITIRSMLAHRSGLPRNGNLPTWYWDPGRQVLRELERSVAESYTAFPPGRQYKYSNFAYVLLGRVIEEMRGQGFPLYMQNHLLEPIGMTESAFLLQQLPDHEPVAAGHGLSDDGPMPLTQSDLIRMPSGNLYGTLGDLTRFVSFLFRGGEADGRQIIGENTLEAMYEVQYTRPRDPQENGLGWFTERRALGEKVVFHSGICQGTSSFLAFLPERKLGVIMLSNSAEFESLAPRFAFEALGLMRESKSGVTPLGRYVGKYIANGEIIEIGTEDGELTASARGHRLNLNPLNPSRYLLDHWLIDLGCLDIEFFPGESVKDDMLILTVEGSYRVTCPRYPDVDSAPPLWHRLAGKYSTHPRVKSRYSEADVLGHIRITIEDNVLLSLDLEAALWPLNDREILLLGGSFDGETMVVDEETGNIVRQNMIHKPSP